MRTKISETKFRYIFRRKNGSHSFIIRIISLEDFEHGFGLTGEEMVDFDIIARDQYTNRHDKNNTEIYVGDIVAIGSILWEVQYDENGIWLVGMSVSHPLFSYDDKELEYKGNIHVNPELLEGTKDGSD